VSIGWLQTWEYSVRQPRARFGICESCSDTQTTLKLHCCRELCTVLFKNLLKVLFVYDFNGFEEEEISNYINNSPYLISTLSRVLIDHMKDRKLHEIGIAPGAQQNTTNRAATSSLMMGSGGMYGGGGGGGESWKIVDCGNYIVHILDNTTRRDLRLEELWSGADPIWKLNVFDDDQVEEYCQRHPVPERYDGTGSREHRAANANVNPASVDRFVG